MLSRKEKKLLGEARVLITRELCEQGEISIRDLGKFYVSEAPCRFNPQSGCEVFPGAEAVKVTVVRFRPWGKVKNLVKQATGSADVLMSALPEVRVDPQSGCEVFPPSTQVYHGEDMIGEPEDTTIVCQGCGMEVEFSQKECPICGLPLEI